MRLTIGQKLFSVVDTTAVVVVRSPDEDVTVTCGDRAMVADDPPGAAARQAPDGPGLLLGKRYTDPGGTVELLCVRAGGAAVAAGGSPVAQKAARALPASD